ncbi:MAG: hypothetical protein FWC98_00650 [Bacteroidales bacterium]|nr:hypothetical protein [Bacteroidales bacterium]
MSKGLKIVLNIAVLLLIVGFGFFMIRSISSDQRLPRLGEEQEISTFVSPYKLVRSFDAESNIVNFYVTENFVFVVLYDKLSVFHLSGDHFLDFPIEPGVRDIAVVDRTLHLLYFNRMEKHLFFAERLVNVDVWEAASPSSDFRALAITENYIFVTDIGERQVVQYNREGAVVRFLRSPDRFILPNRYAFDIITINDTVFVTNSGRHRIESYTLDGEFITWFGQHGAQAGAFIGCCNPMYIAATSGGNILTSERGVPRISSYGRDGSFRMVLFDTHALGGGRMAYRMRVLGENIYIASRNTISVYTFDTTRVERPCNRGCSGCTRACRNQTNN